MVDFLIDYDIYRESFKALFLIDNMFSEIK